MMTLFIADIAYWQGPLTLAELEAAGFRGINVKISHGITQKHVHPGASIYVSSARADGWDLSCFHWLTGDASGVAQADYAYRAMAVLGLNVPGVAHAVDVEDAGVTASIYGDYLSRMTQLLGRPIITYSGDWYAASRPWVRVSALSPWLWSGEYESDYPGDDAASWSVGYGGWMELSVLQYRVAPVAGINVSQSAVRDPALWDWMRGGTVASQAYYEWIDDGRPWRENVPITAMGRRLAEHGYTVYYKGNDDHLKKEIPEDHTPFSATGWPGKSPYPYYMAEDIMPPAAGQKSKLTGKPLPSLQALGRQLYDDRQAGYGPARFVKYMNWEPEGNYTGPCYHDSWMPDHERISSGDRGHIHVSSRTDYYLSTASNSYDLVARTLGDDVTEAELITAIVKALKSTDGKRAVCEAVYNTDGVIPAPPGSKNADGTPNTNWGGGSYATNTYSAAVSARTYAAQALTLLQASTPADVDEAALAAALLPALKEAILAELPEGTLTPEQVEAALRNVLRQGTDLR